LLELRCAETDFEQLLIVVWAAPVLVFPAGLAKDFVSARKVLANGGVVRDIDYYAVS
jgi:hypothetical protein